MSRVLVVVQKNDHSLGYYDLESGAEVARVPVDPYPHEFVLSADRRFAFSCHFGVALAEDEGPGGNSVSIVDIPARKRTGTLDCGPWRRPHGIDLDAEGRLYVLSEAKGELLIADDPHSGVFSRHQTTAGDGSHIVTVTRDGRMAFASNMRSNTVTAIFTDDPERPPVAFAVGERPEGSVLDLEERRLYVTCREDAEIAVIDVDALEPLAPIRTRPGPVRICRDAGGRLLVAHYHDRGLAVIDPDAPEDQAFFGLPDKPVSVAFDEAAGAALLSTLGDEICVVPLGLGRVDKRIPTRPGPDPIAVVDLD